MRDNFTGKAVTMASLRKSVYPSPIWQAHLSNGETLRLSFNCPGNTSPEEMVARARFQAADFIRWIGGPVPSDQIQRETPYPHDLRIKRLYLEDRRHPNDRYIMAGENLNPWADYSAATFKRPRTTVKQVKTVLADLLKTTRDARLMLYAWQGVRRNEGKPHHEELTYVIKECEAKLSQAEQLLAA